MYRLLLLIPFAIQVASCTKLQNNVVYNSFVCGDDARDWDKNYIRVYDTNDKDIEGKFISASLDGQNLPVSSKGCIKVPEGNSSILTVRDNRPTKQEGKIVSLGRISLPGSFKLEPLDAIVPQIKCGNDVAIINSLGLLFPISDFPIEKNDRLAITPYLITPDQKTTSLTSKVTEEILAITFPEDTKDGLYQIEVKFNDRLRNEERTVASCKIEIDRQAPVAALVVDRKKFEEDSFEVTAMTDDKLDFNSEANAEVLVSASDSLKGINTCDETYVPANKFQLPKQRKWLVCFYARDAAGNISTPKQFTLTIDEEPRRLLIEKLIDNAKLNIEKSRELSAQESILRAVDEWSKLALSSDKEQIKPLLKSGLLEVASRSYLKLFYDIETYAPALWLNDKKAILFGEKQVFLHSPKATTPIPDLDQIEFIEARTVSNSARLAAFADSAGRIRVVNGEGKISFIYDEKDGQIYDRLAFSSDDKLLAASSVFGGIKVWKLSDQSLIYNPEDGPRPAAVMFDSNATTLITATRSGQVQRVKIGTDTPVEEISVKELEGSENAILLNNDELLIHSFSKVFSFNFKTKKATSVFSAGKQTIQEVKISPNKKSLGILLDNGQLQILSRIGNKYSLADVGQSIQKSVALFELQNDMIATINQKGVVEILSIEGKELATYQVHEGEQVLGITLQGNDLVTNSAKKILVLDTISQIIQPNYRLDSIAKESTITDLKKIENKLLIALSNGSIWSIDGNNKPVNLIKSQPDILNNKLSDDGQFALRFKSTSLEIIKLSSSPNPIKVDIPDSWDENAIAFSDDQLSFYLGTEGEINRYDLNGKKIATFKTREPPFLVGKIAIEEGAGLLVAAGERRGLISGWRLGEAEKEPTVVNGHDLKATEVAFGSQGYFYSGSDDGYLAKWDSGFNQLQKKAAHPEGVTGLVVINKDNDLFSIGTDNLLRYWDNNLKSLLNIDFKTSPSKLYRSSTQDTILVILGNGQVSEIPVSVGGLKLEVCKRVSKLNATSNVLQYCQ